MATSAEVRIGDLLMAVGRIADARALFEQSIARAARSREFLQTITTRARLAGALREGGSPERALTLFRECLEETQEAVRQSPRSTGRLHTLTLIQTDIGLTLAGREGPSLATTAEGLSAYRAALETGRMLARASDRDPFALLAWVEAAVGFGTVAAEVDPDAARDTLTEALAQLTTLTPRLPRAATDARLLEARARSALSRTLVRLGRPADARPYAEAAHRTLRSLADGDRENAAFGDALVMAGVHFGETLAALGEMAGAEEQLRDAVRVAERLTAATPDRPRAQAAGDCSGPSDGVSRQARCPPGARRALASRPGHWGPRATSRPLATRTTSHAFHVSRLLDRRAWCPSCVFSLLEES